ncbi:hypothetical protein [Williamsia sp.]|uniref:hypothetical protein n=1 Tax=Williamsia sp. TaxID=1872085 RepID=UPI001A1EDF80|nr:hypothetical protein [Williamsia sp.]MBJ7289939.1 hypothetical protein [Williamsia sp.]
MTITESLATALATLTQALDQPGADIAVGLDRLTADAAASIPSYKGLSIIVSQSEPPFAVTVLASGNQPGEIRTSLRFTIRAEGGGHEHPPVDLIFYGGSPGTFVDLAADIAWLTNQPLDALTLDEHLTVTAASDIATQLDAASEINQAIGVLIGRGLTPHEAVLRLEQIVGDNATDRHGAARIVLDTMVSRSPPWDQTSM